MEIEAVPDPDLIDRLGKSAGPRSEGLHLSQIYGSLMQRLQPKRFDKSKPMDRVRVETGLVFENVLEQGLREKFATVRPGEIVSDEGVIMTPDGVNLTYACGEEYKYTSMSARPGKGCSTPYTDEYGMPNQKYMHWFMQMKGYAKWLNTDTFLLRVLHANGNWDWKDRDHGFAPQFLTHRIQFTPFEIEENWQMLMNHARNEGMLA